MDFKGAAIIVTGSSSGIGAAAARMLAERGANVVINYSRSEEPAARWPGSARPWGAGRSSVGRTSPTMRTVGA